MTKLLVLVCGHYVHLPRKTALISFQITGSTGFLGFRILTLALEAGYRVRAAIRHQHQIAVLRAAEIVQSHLADLEFIVVPDILREGAYNEAMQGVTHVVHSAFPSIQPVSRLSYPRLRWPGALSSGVFKTRPKILTPVSYMRPSILR